ncbi:MAG: hypothetical protein LBQ52_04575 [Helicobacteraceae bacterium]|jgi:hypothetical protein|nr:hypothetical protein [Helicobacteraceae bacterium]
MEWIIDRERIKRSGHRIAQFALCRKISPKALYNPNRIKDWRTARALIEDGFLTYKSVKKSAPKTAAKVVNKTPYENVRDTLITYQKNVYGAAFFGSAK